MDIYPGLKNYFADEYYVLNNLTSGNGVSMPYYYLQSNDNFIKKYQRNYPGRDWNDQKLFPLKSINLYNLTSISIYRNDVQTDGFVWHFSYENENRNMLTGLRQAGYNTKYGVIDDGEIYDFEYYDYSQLPKNYLSSAVDHYGYYNGQEFLDVCTDVFNTDFSFNSYEFKNMRTPVEDCMKMGMLKTITYPTGGKTTIEYEANRYSIYKSEDRQSNIYENGITGGLRIKSITDYSDTTTVRRRSYTYSTGVLVAKPKYYWGNWSPIKENSSDTYNMSIAKSSSIIPLVNSFGSHIGYSEVRETNLDGSYTINRFSNFDTINDAPAVYQINRNSPYDKFSDKSYMRGKPLSSVLYSKDNKIQKTTNYYYCDDKAYEYYVLTSNMFCNFFHSGLKFFSGGIYKLYYPKYDVKEIKEISYYANGNDTITRKYIKNDYSVNINYPYAYGHPVDVRLLSEEHLINNGDTQIKKYTYPITNNNIDGFNKYFLLTPQQVDFYRNGNLLKTEKTVYGYFDVYMSNTYWNTIFAPSYIEEKINGKTRRVATFMEYTFSGALKKCNYKGKNTEYQWIENWWNTNKYPCGIDCAVKKKIEGDGLIETQYEYSPFWDVTSITLPSGYQTLYEYDKFRRLKSIAERKPGVTNPVVLQKFEYHYYNGIDKY